jgi:predicted ArsR family transcriptional regulator
MSQTLSPNQDKILYQIKRLGPQTAKALADRVGVTTMGIRQHLGQLEADGLVSAQEPQPQNRGRPVKSWKLTEAGHQRFPDAHAQVTVEIIASVRDLLGDAALDQIIDHRAENSFLLYQKELKNHDSLQDKIVALARLRSDEGYMAEAESMDENSFRLIEQHCPICIAATACQGFCRSELQVFKQLFAGMAEVTREDYLLDGARRCSYAIHAIN